jgi:tRNA A37 threonylcarbamoyladenosine synthetase subunit TsaC/SUA5/YrdC
MFACWPGPVTFVVNQRFTKRAAKRLHIGMIADANSQRIKLPG